MLRLFISLYLVVVIGILSINWLSEWLWSRLEQAPTHEFVTVKALVKSLAQVAPEQLSELKQELSYQLIPQSDIAWLPEQQQALQSGEVLTLYDLQQQLYFYVKTVDQQLLQVGPIAQPPGYSVTKILMQLSSYLLLAIIIMLWTRPVWRDLNKLTRLADNINALKDIPSIEQQSRSPITQVVHTMNKMAARIKHLLREQKQLVNAVSHELRTPLSRLRFSLAMINHITPDQQQGIEQDLQEIETLVDEMLSYSRIEHIAIEQAPSKTNISHLLEHQLDKHRRASHINIISQFSAELVITCNGELIERACQNLITNALRYANKQIKVSATIQNKQLNISVEDDGQGIDKAHWSSLFEPFARIEQSRNKSHGGYGLGLAIVKKACDFHQGSCQICDSSLGGACFIISLPIDSTKQ